MFKMQNVLRWAQIPMGALFVLFGASKFYPFMPTPPMPAEAARFIGAVVETGYLWPLVGMLEIVGGLLLIFNRLTNLALLLLGPVAVHIVLYLLFLVRHAQAYTMSTTLTLFFGASLWARRSDFKALISSRSP